MKKAEAKMQRFAAGLASREKAILDMENSADPYARGLAEIARRKIEDPTEKLLAQIELAMDHFRSGR